LKKNATTVLSVILCVSVCVCVCVCRSESVYVGLMYDLTASYTVGFIILSCVALVALSLITAVYVIDRRMKKSASSTTVVITQSQSADTTKCWPVNIALWWW